MVYNKHEWQNGELITSDKLNNIEDGIDSSTSSINVKDFGAKGDGVSDDSEAILNAIDYAKNNNVKTVRIPNGRYIIKQSIDIPDKIVIVGDSNYSTILLPVGIDYLISLGSYSQIINLQINNSQSNHDVRDISLSTNVNVMWSAVKNIIFMNGYDGYETTGLYISPEGGTSANDLRTIYPNTFSNLYFYGLSNGIYIDNKDYNFINSNTFENIHIRRFSKVGLTITSTGDNGYGVFNNVFSNVEIQAESPVSGEDSRHFVITTGRHNKFDNLNTWSDNHIDVPTITMKLDDFHSDPFSLSDNVFSGTLETGVEVSEELSKINDLSKLEINEWFGTHFNGSVDTLKGYVNSNNNNLLPKGLVENEVNNYLKNFPEPLNVIPSGGTGVSDYSFSVDDIGPYIEINNDCSLFIPLNGYSKTYAINSNLFNVIFDFDIDDNVQTNATVFPSAAYYDISSGNKKPLTKVLKQGAKIGPSTYRLSQSVTPLQQSERFGDIYISITNQSGSSIKVRNVYLVGGVYSVNSKIKEKNYLKTFRSVITNSSPQTPQDIGLFLPKSGDTLLNQYYVFSSSLISKQSMNNKYLVYYPASI